MLFIISVLGVCIITFVALYYQYKYSVMGHSLKAFFIAIAFTRFSFLFFEEYKIAFIILFFVIGINIWVMAIISLCFNRMWTENPYEVDHHRITY